MKEATEMCLETILLSVINVFAVYTAAFNYKLSWVGVMTVMVAVSLITAAIAHFFMAKSRGLLPRLGVKVDEGLCSLLVAAGASLAVFIILVQRFNFPEALGISLLSGGLSSFLRHFMGVYL
jgi:hypothetical protein